MVLLFVPDSIFYVTAHSVHSNVAKIHFKLPAAMEFWLVCLGILAYSCQNTSRDKGAWTVTILSYYSIIYNVCVKLNDSILYNYKYKKKHLTSWKISPYNKLHGNAAVYHTVAIITTKTKMETVTCRGKQQRAGDGGSPVQVNAGEDHSGVSVPRGTAPCKSWR